MVVVLDDFSQRALQLLQMQVRVEEAKLETELVKKDAFLKMGPFF